MRTFHEADALHAYLRDHRRQGRRIALVPTMGNLHAGHHSLVSLARAHAEIVVASVFVNPTQFGPNEDFHRYPRTPERDAGELQAHGCDALFLPAVAELYPYGAEAGFRMTVPAELSSVLEGAIRPGHFDGVATVVAKLFNVVQPDVAVFGEKDFQQLQVIRRLVRDMGYPVDVVAAPIVRESNGLAMSSRNQYLDAEQRERAAAIHATLLWMREWVRAGGSDFAVLEGEATSRLAAAGLVPDYATIRHADDLTQAHASHSSKRPLVGLIAARAGSTRLIDNILLTA